MGGVLGELRLYDLSGWVTSPIPPGLALSPGPQCPSPLIPAPGFSAPEGPARRLKFCEPGLEWKVPVAGDGEREDPPPSLP